MPIGRRSESVRPMRPGDKAGQTSNHHHAGSHSGHQRLLGLFTYFQCERTGRRGNDFGVNLNNGGAGLMTVQAQLKFPIVPPADRYVGKRLFCCSSIPRVSACGGTPLHGDRNRRHADP